MMDMAELTPQQRLFVVEYLKDMNATQAAIRAGYSEKTAASQGQRLLKNVEIRRQIDAALALRVETVKVDADYVLKRLFEMAEADESDCYDESGNLKPIHEWPAVFRKGLVAGLKTHELFEGTGEARTQVGVAREVKFTDRLAVIQTLGKHIGVNAFQEVIQHKGLDALGERLRRAKERKGDK